MDSKEEIQYSSILETLIEYCNSKSFCDDVSAFKNSNENLFYRLANHDTDEHSLIFTDLFNQYQYMLNKHFEIFAEDNGVSLQFIYSNCRDALDDKYTALFSEHEHKWFVELLMSWMEYDSFVEFMIKDVKKNKYRK
jgi:hypothetical protein